VKTVRRIRAQQLGALAIVEQDVGHVGRRSAFDPLRDALPVDEPRRIDSDTELQGIAATGTGFVIDPFNRRWHVAACSRVHGMTIGQSKWFAPTRAALDSYLEARLARYATAKPIIACSICTPGGGGNDLGPTRARMRRAASAAIEGPRREPHLQRLDDGFEIWGDEYVRNQSKATSTAGALKRLIATEIRRLPTPEGRVLHAAYAGERWPGTDVENLLFNNIDQTLALFTAAGSRGVRFEDLGAKLPAAPDGTTRSTFYAYRLAEAGGPFRMVKTGKRACRIVGAVIPEGPARLAARIWLGLRRARPPGCGSVLTPEPYVLRIRAHGLRPATTIKAVVDGASAAMQDADIADPQLRSAVGRLATLLAVDDHELFALVASADAPLGVATGLFTLDGAAQVRVTPDDDRCIAAEVICAGDDEPARLAVDLHPARLR
jgi:hypothetical protein